MSCQWRDKVALYVDGELDAPGLEQFRAHLSSCGECPAAVNAQAEFKKKLHLAGKRFSAPAELHAAVYKSIHPDRRVSPLWKWALAPVCVLLLGVIGYLTFPRSSRDPMVASVVDLHVTNLASANPVDVISSDMHTVKPWFQGRLPFTFNLPDLGGSPFQLAGGRMAYAEQQPGAQLWYQAGPHKISVFVFQQHPASGKEGLNRELSFNVYSWSEGGLEYYLVTDANQDEAGKLASMFKEANRQ